MHDETHVPDIYQYIRQTSISFYFSMGILTTTAPEGKKTSEIFSIVTDIKIWNLIFHRRLEIAVCQVNIWARNDHNNQEIKGEKNIWVKTNLAKNMKKYINNKIIFKKEKKHTKMTCLRRYVRPYVEPTIGTQCFGHKNQLNIQFLL